MMSARRLKTIAAWINENLPELEARICRSHCNTDRKLAGSRLIHRGRGRVGNRLTVYRRPRPGVTSYEARILDHNAAETYRTNDEVEIWLHNYRFCCKAGRHYSMFGSGPCGTCGIDFNKEKEK